MDSSMALSPDKTASAQNADDHHAKDLPLHERETPTRPDFSKRWSQGDAIFSVEGKFLYANKGVCSLWSPVMEAMLNGNFREKDAKQIELPGKKWDDMYELMEVIHPPNNKSLAYATVETVLPLAEEYQMTTLTRQCESFLLSVDPSVRSLVLAERYKLVKLKPKCLDHLKLNMQARKLKDDPDFQNLSPEVQIEVLMFKAVKYETEFGKVEVPKVEVPKVEVPKSQNIPVGMGFFRSTPSAVRR